MRRFTNVPGSKALFFSEDPRMQYQEADDGMLALPFDKAGHVQL